MQKVYLGLNEFFKKYKKTIVFMNQCLTILFYFLYPLNVIYVYLFRNEMLHKIILVPAISFLIVSLSRKLIKRQRPYEKYHYQSMIEKESKENSMPSRHVFSAAIIAMTFFYCNHFIGVILLVLACCSAVIRVIGGVHYISDVIVGFLLGILTGLFLYL